MARPAEPYQPPIRMELEYSQLWKSFHQIGTEMVITKTGRRMFPYCNIRAAGLLPYAKYVIMVDVQPVDNFKYKWNNERWEVAGKAEPQPPCRTYVHPDSPAPGSHWMKQPVSFLKLKLTNNPLDQRGHIILHSMHRYQPRFHVVQADDLYSVRWSVFQTFTFPETTFTAVTVYQNNKITKLKIDHNPFAKGFREEGPHGKRHGAQRRQQSSESSNKKQKTTESEPEFMPYSEMPRLPYDPQRDDSDTALLPKNVQDKHMSPWGGEQDPSQNLHVEGSMDYSSSEQLVPGQTSYHPHRSQNQFAGLSSPDMATVPEQELPRPLPSMSMGSSQCEALDFTNNSKPRPGLSTHPLYAHGHPSSEQPSGQWSGALPGQYPGQAYPTAHPHPHLHVHPHRLMSEHLHPPGYHHTPEWSQYSLFSYSC